MQATQKADHRADLAALPSDWRLVRVDGNKRPIAGDGWFDHDNFSPDDALELNGSGPPAWGLKSGPDSGVVVLDLDAEGWRESFEAETGHPITDLPRTIAWSSGKPDRSGRAFQVDPDWWPYLSNRRSWRNANGETAWELRGDRHQAVIIGQHPETGAYRWLPGCSPQDCPDPAPAPEWLLELLLVQELPHVEAITPAAGDANRAAAMLQVLPAADFTSYGDWLRIGMALHHTDAGLLAQWVDWCRQMPNFDEAECLSKWQSFGKGHKGRPATIATLHDLAKRYGYQEPKRKRRSDATSKAAKPPGFTPRPGSTARWGARPLNHTRRMACFDRCVEVQARRERNSLRRRARLLKAAHDLGLQKFINRDEIAQRVLEAKDAAQGNRFQALTAADRQAMQRPTVRYLVPGVMPAHDMTILGGLAKVGKTRFAVAMVAAVLRGVGMLDMPAPTTTKPVVLVTDDQADGDTHDMLEALQLWDHPGLVWSRNFRLTEHDIDALLAAIAANPGALVVIDSLRSISRNLRHGENDPEIGATLYDLKQAVIDAGGTLLVIHHCNKAQELVGTEALSGHNAIAGAANTILTLHYLPGENGRPNKTAPERRLFREPRSGEGFDLVISRDGNGGFKKVCTLSQWQQQAQEAKEASRRERLSTTQQQVLEALQEAAGAWLTKRQVCDAMGVDWGDRGRGAEPFKVERALKRLVEIGMAESERSGTAASYRTPCGAQSEVLTVLTPLTTSHAKGSEDCQQSADSADTADNQSGTDCQRCQQLPAACADNENPGGDSLSALSALSAPPWLPELLAIRDANPGQPAAVLSNQLMAQHGIDVPGRRVAQLLKAWDARAA